MERRRSSLNPNAASYVPVLERGGRADTGEGSSSAQAGNESVRYGRQPNNPPIQIQPQNQTVRYERQPNYTPIQVQPHNQTVPYGHQPNNTLTQVQPRDESVRYGCQPNNTPIQVQPQNQTVRYGRQPNDTVQPHNQTFPYGHQPNNTLTQVQPRDESVRYGRQPNNTPIQVQPQNQTVRYGCQPNDTPIQVQPQNQTVRYGRQPNDTPIQVQPQNVPQSYVRGGTGAFIPFTFKKRRDHSSGESSASFLHYANEGVTPMLYDETLRRLEMEHPHLPKEYIADVFISRCRRDLKATHDMLLQKDFEDLPGFLGMNDESDASTEAEAEAKDDEASISDPSKFPSTS